MGNTAKDLFLSFDDQAPEVETRESNLRGTPPLFLGPERAITPPPLGNVRDQLDTLCRLVANVTESYSAAIFVADNTRRHLHVGGVHTLSREFESDCVIPFGSGLIGWAAENGVRISVTPFENDASTLLCYSSDQALKSFVALPILDDDSQVLGVISCDSKKSYAFAKLTEKILQDCALQARCLLKLNRKLSDAASQQTVEPTLVREILDGLREYNDEEELLKRLADLPHELLIRDALVVLSLSQGGVGKGKFYTSSQQSVSQHRLLEHVCQHQKIICADRSVHALPTRESENRSFLSVPFRVLDREAGSINLLSKPHASFEQSQIALLEDIARVVGRELERIRLRDRLVTTTDTSGILSWKHFGIRGNLIIAEARSAKMPVALVRVSLENLSELEDFVGIDVATQIMQRIIRLVDQVKGQGGVTCYLYGSQVLFMTDARQIDRVCTRLETLFRRFEFSEFPLATKPVGVRLGDLLMKNIRIASAVFPDDGDNLTELLADTLRKTLRSREMGRTDLNRAEVVENVRTWA